MDRSVIDPAIAEIPNPPQGITVKIVQVDDLRGFELAPELPDIPSLKDGAIDNPATKGRAMARKRNTYGKALGDVLLPEGRSVGDLAQTAVAQGFREAGYRVMKPSDADYAQAAPITVKVQQFWAWVTPGFWALTLEQKSEIDLSGPLPPIQNGAKIRAYVKENPQMVPEGTWRAIIEKGLQELVVQIKAKLGEGGNKVAAAD